MIKAKVVSMTINETVGGVTKLDLETYLEDQVDINSFYGAMAWAGQDVVIMTKEEYESLEEENKALDSGSDTLRKSLLDERKKTKELQEENQSIKDDIKKLEEKMTQDVGEIDLHPDGTIVLRKKRISELEKEVKKLKEENEDLKNKGDEFSLKVTGGLFYYKED